MHQLNADLACPARQVVVLPGTTDSDPVPDRVVGATNSTVIDRTATSERSLERFMSSLWKRVASEDSLPNGKEAHKMAQSIAVVFLARLSRNEEWLSRKDSERFVRASRELVRRLSAHPLDSMQSYAKFWLDKVLARVTEDRNPFPETPAAFSKPLLSGFFARILARRIAKRDRAFAYSLQKGAKLAWPALPDTCLVSSLLSHHKAIAVDSRFDIPEPLCRVISETSAEVFSHLPVMNRFCPSSSACYEINRGGGGALNLFKTFEPECVRGPPGILIDLNRQFDEWRSEQFRIAQLSVIAGCQFDVDTQVGSAHNLGNIDVEDLKARVGYCNQPSQKIFDVKIVPIPEPGKFRIISKGSGRLYTALQPLQGAMLSAWKHHPSSTMLTPELTARVQQLQNRKHPSFSFWASVDYKAATDNLRRQATLRALDGLPEGFAKTWAFASVTPGRMRYSFPEGLRPEGFVNDVMQGEGQLMGHPISFPLLCIINLACYRASLEEWVRRDLSRKPWLSRLWNNVITNGDDMLFPSDEELYAIFLKTSSQVGFIPSAGKNYLSPHTALINSQMFSIVSGVVRRVGYFNQRLLLGHTLKEGDSLATPTQICIATNEMVALCPWTQCAIPWVMNRWTGDQRVNRPNWFLPVVLGGYGLSPRWAPDSLTITRHQRKLASAFRRDPRLSLYLTKYPGKFIPQKWFQDLLGPVILADPLTEEGKRLVELGKTGWEARLQSMEYCMASPKATEERLEHLHERKKKKEKRLLEVPPPSTVCAEQRIRAIKIPRNLKPMSDKRIMELWNWVGASSSRGKAPPASSLSYSTEWEIEVDGSLPRLKSQGVALWDGIPEPQSYVSPVGWERSKAKDERRTRKENHLNPWGPVPEASLDLEW